MKEDLKDTIYFILHLLLIIFLVRSCKSEQGIIKYSIDTIYEYYNYADSLFNK